MSRPAANRQADHLCGNKGCINPGHLEAVTSRTNLLRSPITVPAINAAKTHCQRGHEFTPDNTGTNGSNGGRYCRTCERANARARYRRRKEHL